VSRFDEETLVLYAAGRLDESRRQEIADATRSDEELRATLEVIGVLSGLGESGGREASPTPLRRVRESSRLLIAACRRHPVWLALAVLVAVSSIAGAGWMILMPRFLLHDDFNDNWFDSRVWLSPPAFGREQGVREQDGRLKLLNRGFLISKQEFSGPVDVSFDWRWSELGFNPIYADHLTIALRSSARTSQTYPYEIEDGVVIRVNAWTGYAAICVEPGSQHMHKSGQGMLKLSADTWHHIRITDDGEHVAVYVTGRNDPEHPDDRPVVEGSFPTAPKSGHLVLYNREKVGGVPHESYVDNIIVRRLP